MELSDALRLIDEAVERSDKQVGADFETTEALRFLWRYKNEVDFRDALTWFKESLGGPNRIGRFQNANASRNRIKWLLGGGT